MIKLKKRSFKENKLKLIRDLGHLKYHRNGKY